ncbi:MAG: RluA family pseudouridine synthase [Desulfobacterales bacterium]|nr:MAG: RluA family pseudouridine synthase [Desulfobacterales bacterium]
MPIRGAFAIVVDKSEEGRRLDVVIAARLPECSRSLAASLIAHAKILVDGRTKKPGYRVKPGDEIRGHIPPPAPVRFNPEPIPLDILFEDEHIVVVNKPAGLVVHPAPGHASGTLVNGLLYHCPTLGGIGGVLRPGIVHRLDKDTSGTLVVAKTASAHENLARQFKSRGIQKTYLALVYGEMAADSGGIGLPIGRHPVDRKRMSTQSRKARAAETSWRVRERWTGITLLELDLQTGRTHQLRVHCAALHHPIVGDPVYGRGRSAFQHLKNKGRAHRLCERLKIVSRQMLHAWRLAFTHPQTGQWVSFASPLPADMEQLIAELRNNA